MDDVKEEKKNSFKEFVKAIAIDSIACAFVFVGLWAITHGIIAIYESYYEFGKIKPSVLGDSTFWIVEGIFFLLLALVTYKEKKIVFKWEHDRNTTNLTLLTSYHFGFY